MDYNTNADLIKQLETAKYCAALGQSPTPPPFTANNKVAIKAIEGASGVQTKLHSGFATAAQKTALTECEVVFFSFDPNRYYGKDTPALLLGPGDKVFVRGDALAAIATNVQELDGVKYLLIESSMVQIVKPGPR
jgi:hypothetical protein